MNASALCGIIPAFFNREGRKEDTEGAKKSFLEKKIFFKAS